MNKPLRAITLLELVIVSILLVMVVMAVWSIDSYSRHHVLTADRRTRLQNEVSYILEHIHKYVFLGVGNVSSPAIVYNAGSGFTVSHVDLNYTPANLSDDLQIQYLLNPNNTISCFCTQLDGSSPPCPADCPVAPGEELCRQHILANVTNSTMPQEPSTGYTSGFYINITDGPTTTPPSGTTIEVGLVARWDPTTAKSVDNPQVEMKTRVYATGASAK
jgi:hypothetical protein